jgi:hypothetical protein
MSNFISIFLSILNYDRETQVYYSDYIITNGTYYSNEEYYKALETPDKLRFFLKMVNDKVHITRMEKIYGDPINGSISRGITGKDLDFMVLYFVKKNPALLYYYAELEEVIRGNK